MSTENSTSDMYMDMQTAFLNASAVLIGQRSSLMEGGFTEGAAEEICIQFSKMMARLAEDPHVEGER